MHIAFLGSADTWYLRDLRRAAGDRHMIEPMPFSRLESCVTNEGVTVETGLSFRGDKSERQSFRGRGRPGSLTDYDCVLVRTMPAGSLEQVVFRMDALASLEAAGTMVVNPPKAIEAAVDKYLTTSRLARAGLLVPRTIVCQTTDTAMEAFHALGGDVVMKPIFGGEGRGITRLADEAFALRAFKLVEQLGGVLYLQEFVEHEGYDVRILMIGNTPLAMRRRNPLDWRTNVSRGARAEAYEPTNAELDMARCAAAAVGAPLAGVDLLPARDGRLFAIEVNAVPGWRALATATRVDVSQQVLSWIELQLH